MTAEPHELPTARTLEQIIESLKVDRSPRNIRACLPPEDRDHFDKDYRQIMARAMEELDLAPVNDTLAHWWHVARMKASGEYEEVLARAVRVRDQIERGEQVSGRPLRDVLAERAAELGVKLDL
ncbi:hypothetical protein Pth03_18480 [Planotetraspora thailandica]|uniref:Uncharacterized protein n=1 Tax=Planotetraspora thailandica TaxID=487172 RepID=A0A8J3V3N8_9ACTN|nr:DUF6247 family protein [Planotetraspora thailandica]GII53459.1 hypothetical protein Pth03_18480 [Planotetraspora thailandica]